MMLNSKSIGNKIATARKKVNLSQADLAQQVSISSQAVGKWERGESMPDITTLNRLAEIFGVDLNYFSEKFSSANSNIPSSELVHEPLVESSVSTNKANWDMSKLNLVDSDFSGLKNLHEKLNLTNIQRCLFIGSDLSNLQLKRNNVSGSDFSDSDFSNSHLQNSHLTENKFKNCSLNQGQFSESYFDNCDFSDANFNAVNAKSSYFSSCNFSGTDFNNLVFKSCGVEKSIVSNAIFNNSSFISTHLADLVFEGTIKECRFEECTFNHVRFENATLINTFFKNNRKFKRVEFINCKVDKITYAFLKNNLANLSEVTILA